MSAAVQQAKPAPPTPPKADPPRDERPKLDALRWCAVRYQDGSLGNGLDLAKAAIIREARKDGLVVGEWTKSGSILLRTESYEMDVNPHDGTPIMGTRRTCVVFLVALLKQAPPERWVRLTSTSGPAAVEVATVDKGKVVKRETYHAEDMRHIAAAHAVRALEECAG